MQRSYTKISVIESWLKLIFTLSENVNEVRAMRVIEGDGVHFTSRANRNAAVSLCRRVREMVLNAGRDFKVEMEEEGGGKRRRID